KNALSTYCRCTKRASSATAPSPNSTSSRVLRRRALPASIFAGFFIAPASTRRLHHDHELAAVRLDEVVLARARLDVGVRREPAELDRPAAPVDEQAVALAVDHLELGKQLPRLMLRAHDPEARHDGRGSEREHGGERQPRFAHA